MFLSFFLPFRAKNMDAPYLWVFYKQLTHFTPEQIIFVGSEDYFRSPQHYIDSDRWDVSIPSQCYAEYSIPSELEIETYRKIVIPSNLFEDLEDSGHTNEEIIRHLLTERNSNLEDELDKVFSQLAISDSLEAVLTFCNVPSLAAIAKRYDLPVIHNELGPLRKPCYHDTAYFDFQGVNGNTEANARYSEFSSETDSEEVAILDRDGLLRMFLRDEKRVVDNEACYDVGLPLQVENDSNIIAFSNGWDNQRLIDDATSLFGVGQSLVRKHPGGLKDYNASQGVEDSSKDSIEFIRKCRSVVTINSSVGLESMLLGVETTILGDSPFAFVASNSLRSSRDRLPQKHIKQALNFLLFGYLIPYEFLFDVDYYRWRLSGPSEVEIFEYHLNYMHRRRQVLGRDFKFSTEGFSLTDAGLLKFERRKQYEALKKSWEDGQYVNTLSWRMTAPLRALRNIFESRKKS